MSCARPRNWPGQVHRQRVDRPGAIAGRCADSSSLSGLADRLAAAAMSATASSPPLAAITTGHDAANRAQTAATPAVKGRTPRRHDCGHGLRPRRRFPARPGRAPRPSCPPPHRASCPGAGVSRPPSLRAINPVSVRITTSELRRRHRRTIGPCEPPRGVPDTLMEETVSKGQDDSLPAEGGDSACWAHLVCPGCGAITSEAHREGCGLAPESAQAGSC